MDPQEIAEIDELLEMSTNIRSRFKLLVAQKIRITRQMTGVALVAVARVQQLPPFHQEREDEIRVLRGD